MPGPDDPPPGPTPAGLERRLLAFAIDQAVYAAVLIAVVVGVWLGTGSVLATVLSAGLALLVACLLGALLTGTTGLTPGKGLLGLRVVDERSGLPIGVGAALLRALLLGLGTLGTFGLGAAVLAWTALTDPGGRRRGWHDRVTEAVVVDARSAPAPVVEADPGPRHVVNLTAMRLVPPEPSFPVPAPVLAPPPERGVASTRDRHRTVSWRIVFDGGETYLVSGLTLIGRRPEPRHDERPERLVTLSSPKMSVSKTHAQVSVAADGVLVLLDRGSTNGTELLRKGVTKPVSPGRATTLLPGDRVRLGDREMTVVRES